MKRALYFLLTTMLALCLSACGSGESTPADGDALPPAEDSVREVTEEAFETGEPSSAASETATAPEEEEVIVEQTAFDVTVGGKTFSATFADNPGAQAFGQLLAGGAITLEMSDYAGFEKVGPLGQSLPAGDSQTTTQAGDIVLYQGDQIVIFYGSNSWSYTRLGKIDDLTGWAQALGSGSVSVTFSLQN